MRSFRNLMTFSGLLILVLIITACAPPAAAPAAPAPAAPAAEEQPAAEPAKGGDLIIAVPANSEPASFDGHIDPYQSTWLYNSFVADALIVLTPEGKSAPNLATSWEISEDGNGWIFHLRDDVTFQDGAKFNAEAVKYNLERVKAPETASAQASDDLGPITSVDVVDEYTIQINYDAPWVTLPDTLRRLPIWSPTAAEKWGLTEFDRHLVGTGPFLFTEWVPNDHVTFTRWEDYGGWNSVQEHEGAVYLNSVTIKFIGEAAVLGSVVNTGDADITQELPSQYVPDYKETSDAHLVVGYQAGTGLQMVMNIRNAPLNDIRVRQALLHGADQEALNDLIYDGLYLVQKGPLNVVHPCVWEGAADVYPPDPAKAGELLDEAGWKDEDGDGIREAHGVEGVADGTPLQIRFTVLHHAEIGEALQAQYRPIGIDLVLEVVPGPVQLDRVNKRDFDLIYERQRSPDPRILDQIWNSKGDQPGGWAWTGFKDENLDAILDQITSVSDEAKRCELAIEAQKIVMENALTLPTVSQPVYFAVSNKVQNFKLGAEGNWFFLNDTYMTE